MIGQQALSQAEYPRVRASRSRKSSTSFPSHLVTLGQVLQRPINNTATTRGICYAAQVRKTPCEMAGPRHAKRIFPPHNNHLPPLLLPTTRHRGLVVIEACDPSATGPPTPCPIFQAERNPHLQRLPWDRSRYFGSATLEACCPSFLTSCSANKAPSSQLPNHKAFPLSSSQELAEASLFFIYPQHRTSILSSPTSQQFPSPST